MAGYSGTPLAKKLGIKPGGRVVLVGAPREMRDWLAPLPDGVTFAPRGPGEADVVVFFTRKSGALAERFAELAALLTPAGGLWIAWPKKASQVPTDVTEALVRKTGLDAGLVDNKICAISEVWSGLRFVYRLKHRGAHSTRGPNSHGPG